MLIAIVEIVAAAITTITAAATAVFACPVLAAPSREAAAWEDRFGAARRRFHRALAGGESVPILSMLFDHLNVLRNQVMHGGSTWNSGGNRDQLQAGAAILRSFVPVMVDHLMNAPEENWGEPMYPVVEG